MKTLSVTFKKALVVPMVTLAILMMLIPYTIVHHSIYTTQYIFAASVLPALISRLIDFLSVDHNHTKVLDWISTVITVPPAIIVGLCMSLIVMLIALPIPKRKTQVVRFMLWITASTISFMIGANVKKEGQMPKSKGPFVFVAPHGSFLDYLLSILIMGYKIPYTVLYGTNLHWVPIMTFFLKRYGVGVDRLNPDSRQASLDAMKIALSKGLSILLYPEGTRRRKNLEFHKGKELLPFHNGAFYAAIQSNCDVVPVGIEGAHEFRSPDHYFPFSPRDIFIRYGKNISSSGKEVSALKNESFNAVLNLI